MSSTVYSSSEFLTAIYEVDGPESLARRTAERICVDQTIEAEHNLLPHSLQSMILGHLEDLRANAGGRFHATIRFRGDLLSGECSDVLNVLFGTSSLRGDVTLLSFTMTNGEQLVGLVAGESGGQITLRIGVDQERRIRAADVKSRQESRVSPMMEGLLDALSLQQIADLLEYLSTLK